MLVVGFKWTNENIDNKEGNKDHIACVEVGDLVIPEGLAKSN